MNEEARHLIVPVISATDPEREGYSIAGDLSQLMKARLSLLVLITTFVGFCMASTDAFDWFRLMNTLLGTGLVAGAAAVLNQVIETRVDRLMGRTKDRPLPAGRMSRSTALGLGVVMASVGLLNLFVTTTILAAFLASVTLLVYLAIYTPMKRRTSLCVAIGAVSGAIPPIIGWAAVHGSVQLEGWVLFGILFTWQMPHFLAIAWMYRDEYSQAGFVMLRKSDVTGFSTAIQSLVFSILLAVISLIPFFAQSTGLIYLIGALLLNGLLIWFALQFLLERSRSAARKLFFTSIAYLPGILCLMVVTKK